MDELERKIKNWVLKNGYPFEMEVASLFQKEGFKISQSLLYKDTDTNKYREIDVIAYLNKVVNGVSFSFSFVIECKKSTNKPWLVFKNKNLINPKLNRFKPFATKNAEILLDKINGKEKYKNLFPNINNAGYNLVVAFKESKDLAYSATTSLLKACDYLIHKFNNFNLKQCNIYIPMVLIEGVLFDACLDIKNELNFNKVNSSVVMNTKILDENNSNLITIASSNNLQKYIQELKKDIDDFFEDNESDLIEISKTNPVSI